MLHVLYYTNTSRYITGIMDAYYNDVITCMYSGGLNTVPHAKVGI